MSIEQDDALVNEPDINSSFKIIKEETKDDWINENYF